MEKGIYTLILRLDSDVDIVVGALGTIRFEKGYYAYTGSARGPGGLKRVERHLEVMRGTNPTRRWHIDYLLPFTHLEIAVTTKTEDDLECAIAKGVGSQLVSIPRFGCTDCKCKSHLHFSRSKEDIKDAVRSAHAHFL